MTPSPSHESCCMQGMILFAHGARDARWAEPFERTATRLRDLVPAAHVALAYLEFMSPNLADCANKLIAQGCTRMTVLPVFLSAGGHVRKDLPAQVDALRQAHPSVTFELHTAAGESELLVEAIAQWAAGAAA